MKRPMVLLVALSGCLAALGADVSWSDVTGSGKWSDKGNWLGGVMPQTGDTVHISNNVKNASMIVDTAGVSIKSLRIEGLESITIRGEKLTLTGNEFSLAAPSPKPEGANNLRDYMKSKAPLLCYYAGAVISNDLEFTGTGDSVGLVITEKPVTFWGNVSVPNATTFRMHNGLSEETNCKWNLQHASVSPLLEFRNGLNAPNAKVLMVQAVTGPVDYYGTVRANRICTDQYIGSEISFRTDDVEVSNGSMDVYYAARMSARAKNAFPANAIFSPRLANSSNSDYSQSYLLYGFDQAIDRLGGDFVQTGAYFYDKGGNVSSSSGTPTLTLNMTDNATTALRLKDKISLVVNASGDYTQTFTGRVHTTTGSLTVQRGKLRMDLATSFAQVPAVTVASGAAFEVDTDIPQSLKSVASLAVAGTFELKQGDSPFDPSVVKLALTTGGKIVLPAGLSLSVRSATLDGKDLPIGHYRAADTDWVEGEGAEVVVSCTTWTKADLDAYEGGTIDVPEGCVLEFNYTSAMTSRIDKVITGKGAVRSIGNGGEIVFAAANTFSGGFTHKGVTLCRALTSTGFGTGPITIATGKNGSAIDYGVWFGSMDVGGLVFDNPINVTEKTYVNFQSKNSDPMTVNGKITSTVDLQLRSGRNEFDVTAAGTIKFYGDIDATSCDIYKIGDKFGAKFYLYGKVKARNFISSTSDWGRGEVHFCNADNELEIVAPGLSSTFYADTPDCFPASVRTTFYYPSTGYTQGDGELVLNENLTIDRIFHTKNGVAVDATTGRLAKEIGNYSAAPSSGRTLTMKATAGTYSRERFKDNLSVDWAPQGDYTLALSNRLHTMNGTFTVSRGTVIAGEGTEFSRLKKLVIRAGARFVVDPGHDYTKIFTSGKTEIEIEEGGVLELASDRLAEQVGAVRYGGSIIAKDTYRKSAGAPWLDGAGTVATDPSNLDGNIWMASVDGSWADGTKWVKGRVPAANEKVTVDAYGADYTVTLGSASAAIASLDICNKTSGKTATLSVTEDGTFAPAANAAVVIGDGGVLSVDGGTFAATEKTDGSLTVRKGGKLRTSGTFAWAAKQQTGKPTPLTVEDGGVFEITGGTALFDVTSWGHDALVVQQGGFLDVSGNALVGSLDGSTDQAYFGDGYVRFRGNSTFGRWVTDGAGGRGIRFCQGSGGPTGVLEFVEHARLVDAGSSFRIDRNIGTMRILLGSDAEHFLNYMVYVGRGTARGELIVTNGTVSVGTGYGLRVPGLYEMQGSTAALHSEGLLDVRGGTVTIDARNSSNNYLAGLIVGDRSIAVTNDTEALFYDDVLRGWCLLSGTGRIVNNPQSQVVVGVGAPKAEGHLVQTGGSFENNSNQASYPYVPMVIGMAGATGDWTVSGGTATVACSVYVGGITTTELQKEPGINKGSDGQRARIYPGYKYAGSARGTATFTGGDVRIGGNLVLSGDGTGELVLGGNAKLAVEGRLDARSGSKLTIDLRGYTGHSRTLATFGGTTTAFAQDKVELLQDDGECYTCSVTDTLIRIKHPPRTGSVIFVR